MWSDIHLGHAMTLGVFGRPFWTPEGMDDNGEGIAEPADILMIGGSHWAGSVELGEDPAGIGMCCLNTAAVTDATSARRPG